MYLVFSEKSEEFARIRATLGQSPYEVSNRHELLSTMDSHPEARILIIAPGISSELAFEIASELQTQFPYISVILIRNLIDVPTLSAALESGIKDVIDSKDATGLNNSLQRCQTLIDSWSSRVDQQGYSVERGKVITVFAAKGGCGKTTVASNLASALAEDSKNEVCLVDFDLEFGDIGTVLGISPDRNISQALEMGDSVDIEGMKKVLARYDNRFDVLLAPVNPSEIDQIASQFASRVIKILQRNYDYVVIDTSPTLTPLIRRTLQDSDIAILLTTLDLPAIKNLKIALAILDQLGIDESRRLLVLNRADAKVGLEPSDVTELIGKEISISIPANSKVSSSINEGRPLVDLHRTNPVSRAILELAKRIEAR
jgi:pilus assembly protein CpaE